jgi:paraquat-inducible protein B
MSDNTHIRSEFDPDLPEADVKRRKGRSVFWLIPIAAAVLAGWLIWREHVSTGHKIHIQFDTAAGLEAGKSPVRYRGVKVGIVDGLKVSADREHCMVTVVLFEDYRDLAREGARFWVVRPQISGEGIQGLGTLISQNYIQLQLSGEGERKTEFTGLNQAPAATESMEKGGLRVVLLAPNRWGLGKGAGVYYRGMQVGTLLDSELGPTSSTVRFTLLVYEPFVPLVRLNSKFWKSGGLDVSAGLFSGLDVRVNDLRNLLQGGVDFATPDQPGEMPDEDAVFRLYAEPDEKWTEWRPEIPIQAGEVLPPQDRRSRRDEQ